MFLSRMIATTANDTDLWLAVALSRAKAVETRVETLWATCAAAAYRLWAPRHNILGCAIEEFFAPFNRFDPKQHGGDVRKLLFLMN
jgi:hypothetical protein